MTERNISIERALNDPFCVRRVRFEHRGGLYRFLDVDVLPVRVERIVPPAGERYAFDRIHYERRVQVSISPTGRSVRVWVDGNEVGR